MGKVGKGAKHRCRANHVKVRDAKVIAEMQCPRCEAAAGSLCVRFPGSLEPIKWSHCVRRAQWIIARDAARIEQVRCDTLAATASTL